MGEKISVASPWLTPGDFVAKGSLPSPFREKECKSPNHHPTSRESPRRPQVARTTPRGARLLSIRREAPLEFGPPPARRRCERPDGGGLQRCLGCARNHPQGSKDFDHGRARGPGSAVPHFERHSPTFLEQSDAVDTLGAAFGDDPGARASIRPVHRRPEPATKKGFCRMHKPIVRAARRFRRPHDFREPQAGHTL